MTAAPTAPVTTGPGAVPTSSVTTTQLFIRACAAEWTRLWTVRATWGFLAAATIFMLGIGLAGGLSEANDPPLSDPDSAWPAASLSAVPSQFALLALALGAVTADYATGGMVASLQWTPRRNILFASRTVVAILTATAVGVLLATASVLTAYVAAQGAFTLPLDEGLEVFGKVAFVYAADAALAVGLGFLLRSTAGGIIAAFLLILVLPALLPQFGYEWLDKVADSLPGSGALFLLLGELPGMSDTRSVVVLSVWAVGALALGWLRFRREDADQ